MLSTGAGGRAPVTAIAAQTRRMPLLLADRAATRAPLPLITSAEARALRLPVSGAACTRVRRGVYADAAAAARLTPWARYALRVHAFAVTHPGTMLCLESAAVLHGLPLFGEARDIHVFDAERTSSRRFGDVCVHTSSDPRESVERAGIPVTSLLDTVVDLCRVLPPAQALTVADAAISPAQGGTLDLDRLRERSADQVSRRGVARLAWTWARADGLAESPGESVSRAVIRWCGFEDPVLQPVFGYEGVDDRVDFLFPSARALGESDGWGKYDLHDAARAEQHLRNEKRREDRLRRAGHPFARWDLADAVRVDPLATALQRADVPLVRTRDRGGLATLGRSPRTLASRPR